MRRAGTRFVELRKVVQLTASRANASASCWQVPAWAVSGRHRYAHVAEQLASDSAVPAICLGQSYGPPTAAPPGRLGGWLAAVVSHLKVKFCRAGTHATWYSTPNDVPAATTGGGAGGHRLALVQQATPGLRLPIPA